MKSQILLSTLVVVSLGLALPVETFASKKSKRRAKIFKSTKKNVKPVFKLLSARSMKSWAYNEMKLRRLKVPKGTLRKMSHPDYREDGVTLSIGRPFHEATESSITCYRTTYDKRLWKDIKNRPSRAAACITLKGRAFIAKAKFKLVGDKPRLFMLTFGMKAPIEFFEIKALGGAITPIPEELWQWNETANQYQALVNLTPSMMGNITLNIYCDIDPTNSFNYSAWFHHLQLMAME